MLINCDQTHTPPQSGEVHTYTHMQTYTTQSQHVSYMYMYMYVHVQVHRYLCGRFNRQICIAVMSAGRGIEESSVLEVSATEYNIPELSPVHLQYVNETSIHCTHVYTCTYISNIIHTYHIQWYNVQCKYV